MSRFTIRRGAARAVVLDRAGRVLLLRAHDPYDRKTEPWWEIPGGGIDPGETSEACARREVWEEAGLKDIRVGPCVWVQHAVFTFAGLHFDQDEHIHVAWYQGAEAPASDTSGAGVDETYRPGHLEALEALAFEGMRWWTVEALLASDERVLPPRLREFLPALAAGEIPDSPIDIT